MLREHFRRWPIHTSKVLCLKRNPGVLNPFGFVICHWCFMCTLHTETHTAAHCNTYYNIHCMLFEPLHFNMCSVHTFCSCIKITNHIPVQHTHIYIYIFGGHKIFISFRLSCLIIYLLLRLHWFAMHEWNSYTNDTIAHTKYSMQIKSFVFLCVCVFVLLFTLGFYSARCYFTLFIFIVVVDHQYLSHEIRYSLNFCI